MTELYKKDSSDRIRIWRCWSGTQNEDFGVFTQDGIKDGKIKDPVFKKAMPKNIGKANYRSAEDQSIEMVSQKVKAKLSGDYFTTIEEANSTVVFKCTGCPSGMIWDHYKDMKHVVYPALASPKLDGSKLYSSWRDNRVFLNTRSGKEHYNFKHISEELEEFYKKNKNIVLDGEAYNHEYSDRFEDLQSIFRKEKPTEQERELSKNVSKFYIYDVYDADNPELTAGERQLLLEDIFDKYFTKSNYLIKWESIIVQSEKVFDNYYYKWLDDGFEGAVLKITDQPYIQRKNKFVMKRKEVYDCEFKIIDVIEGTGTNAGMAATIVLDLTNPHGMNKDHMELLTSNKQDAGIGKGWNADKKADMLNNKADYIGKWATFEYGGVTNHGRMRFPKFKSLRDINRS